MEKAKTIKDYFTLIKKTLQNEHLKIINAENKFAYTASEEQGVGINTLEEKHIQYVLYKAFLKEGHLIPYIEKDYPNDKRKHCDFVLFNTNKSYWIEIKNHGFCNEKPYIRSTKEDIEKLQGLNIKGAQKYCLATSVEDKEPNILEWEEWFNNVLPEAVFDSNLFSYFKTRYYDKEEFKDDGYYTICLLNIE